MIDNEVKENVDEKVDRNTDFENFSKDVFIFFLGCFLFGVAVLIIAQLLNGTEGNNFLSLIELLFEWDLFIFPIIGLVNFILIIYFLMRREDVFKYFILLILSIFMSVAYFIYIDHLYTEIKKQWSSNTGWMDADRNNNNTFDYGSSND